MQKIYRLRSNRAFNYVHKKGKSVANKELILLYAPTKYSIKVGFSVSKKIGNAVCRNKVRRRLKEGFRLLIPFINKNFNYIVMARPGIHEKNYHELVRSTVYLLNKANLILDCDGINSVK